MAASLLTASNADYIPSRIRIVDNYASLPRMRRVCNSPILHHIMFKKHPSKFTDTMDIYFYQKGNEPYKVCTLIAKCKKCGKFCKLNKLMPANGAEPYKGCYHCK